MHRFWDIECYDNLFCVGFLDENEHLDMFYLCDKGDEVEAACRDSGYDYTCYDLAENGHLLEVFMENPIPSNGEATVLSTFLGVDNEKVEPKKDWYFSYNGANYDIPMIDYVIHSGMTAGKVRLSTETLRRHSNALITQKRTFAGLSKYLRYGNHVDVALLNETKIERGRPTVGLKTLAGILGGSIIESESNNTGHSESIYSDILYNINDVAELKHRVFKGFLHTKFKTKKNLLERYPHLLDNGVTVNSTSAKFVEYIIAPENPIEDLPVVNYAYPAKHIAERYGMKQVNILENTKDWYLKNVYLPISKVNPKAAKAHLAKFMSICGYYGYYEGKNWNESTRHIFKYQTPGHSTKERRIADRTYGVILPFIRKDGVESPSYVRFSVGGIHGAEINAAQLAQDRETIRRLKEQYGYISKIPKGTVSNGLLQLIIKQSRTPYEDYPVRCSHEIPYFFEHTKEVDEIIDPEEFSPYMVQKMKHEDGLGDYQEMVIERYKYTSTGKSTHQDFISYYPMLMIMLGTFYDGKGKDPYAEVKDLRVTIKAKLKELPFGSTEYNNVNDEQEGYKLILNSASGILDGSHDTNLRANNKAMTMRIIGQLFTFRIGMALALEGAVIPSSNTDGIYACGIDLEKNRVIVDTVLKDFHIEIEPEELFLVSKDSNNRMEIVDGKVVSAKGGTISSWKGAQVDTSLAHPALVDKILTLYLPRADLMKPVNKTLIRDCLEEYLQTENHRKFVYMASWILRSTSGSIFVDSAHQVHKGTIRAWLSDNGVSLTRYNTRATRCGTTTDEYAAQLFPASVLGKPEVVEYLSSLNALENTFPKAVTVEQYQAFKSSKLAAGQTWKDVNVSVPVITDTKITNLSDTARLFIDNRCIDEMKDVEIEQIYEHICIQEYVDLIATFADTWHNPLVPS